MEHRFVVIQKHFASLLIEISCGREFSLLHELRNLVDLVIRKRFSLLIFYFRNYDVCVWHRLVIVDCSALILNLRFQHFISFQQDHAHPEEWLWIFFPFPWSALNIFQQLAHRRSNEHRRACPTAVLCLWCSTSANCTLEAAVIFIDCIIIYAFLLLSFPGSARTY